MPFKQLQNPQQIEAVVGGPGDVNRLYVCAGLATGTYAITVGPNQSESTTDTWQFEVGPHLDVTQFRRAIASVSFAGFAVDESGGGGVSWIVRTVFADFDDDAGFVRVSVTNSLLVDNTSGDDPYEAAGVSALGYNVSILGALPAGA